MSQYIGGAAYQPVGYRGGAGGMSSMDVQRNKHISLLRSLTDCREVNPAEFVAALKDKTGQSRLPPGFPMSPPEIRIAPPCRSPYIDAEMCVVKYRDSAMMELGLGGTWTVHKDIAQMVNDVRNTLWSTPPVPLDTTAGANFSPGGSGASSAWQFPAAAGGADASPRTAAAPASSAPLVPPLKTSFPELEELSTERLQELIDDEGAFVDFFNDLPLVRELDKRELELREENLRIAQENLACKDPLAKLREELLEQHEILQVRKLEYDEKQAQLRRLVDECSRERVIERLEQAKAAAFAEARDLKTAFEKGGCVNLDEFVRDHRALCEKYHMIKLKLDKLKDAPR